MQVVIIGKNNKARLNKVLEFALYIFGYTVSFLIVSSMFETFKLSDDHTLLYAILSVTIIFVLNKTIKPILVFFTLPITAITLGLFYFALNTMILKIADLLMFDKLDFTNIWILFIISIIISIVNLLIELLIIKPIIRRVKTNE